MTASKSLPAHPSVQSLRKQAKKLVREIAAGDTDAIARARTQLPSAGLPLTLRNAQLVIAREYGHAGWQDLIAEVSKRLGHGLEWAAAQARRVIHDNDFERLKELLTEYPALLRDGGLLEFATSSYGDSFEPERERNFTRAACAEMLIDAGAIVTPSVFESLIQARTRGLLQLFQRKGLLPRTLRFFAALGDLDAVRTSLDASDLAAVNEAFTCACSFEREAIASVVLDRAIALDPELGRHVDGGPGRPAFIRDLIERRSLTFTYAAPSGPWQEFVMERAIRAIEDGDLTAFVRGLQREPWLLDEDRVEFQMGMIERATMRDRGEFITALLDLEPAIARRQPPPRSQAIEFALTYEKPHLIPLLTRLWPLPDDLPHAAGMGNLARVKQLFDENGAPRDQQVLDTALAYSVINRHFEIADFLLAHGADINTTWSSHEPASILHELVFHENYESMQFLIDRGIDMTIKDYRWNATATGWARYGKSDEKMAQWLEEAERQRERRR